MTLKIVIFPTFRRISTPGHRVYVGSTAIKKSVMEVVFILYLHQRALSQAMKLVLSMLVEKLSEKFINYFYVSTR